MNLHEKAQAKAKLMKEPFEYHALVINEKRAINALIDASARGEDLTGRNAPRRILDTIIAAGVGEEWLKSAYRKLGVSNVTELIDMFVVVGADGAPADLYIEPPDMTGDVACGEKQAIARAGAQRDRELEKIP